MEIIEALQIIVSSQLSFQKKVIPAPLNELCKKTYSRETLGAMKKKEKSSLVYKEKKN